MKKKRKKKKQTGQAKSSANQKRPLQQKASPAERQRQIKTWRQWLFRFALLVIVPVSMTVCLEAALRVIDYGVPSGFTFHQKVGSEERILSNPYFTWRFFAPHLAKESVPFSLPLEKAKGTYRLFVLGASAAQGDPEAAYGMTRMLEVMLRDQYPGIDFEVINAAITATNSHVVLPIIKECSRLGSDLFIIYLGNNEVVGPYGAGTVFSPVLSSMPVIRAGIALKATRLGQLLSDVMEKIPGRSQSQPGRWLGMAMFLGHQVRQTDPGMETVYHHFEKNLLDMLLVAQKAGVPAIVSTVGANIKDCAPFASLHRPGLSEKAIQRWEALVQEGEALREQGSYIQALKRFQQAELMDPDYAELQYRMGRCYWAMWDFTKARAHYAKALELDTLRFRADSRINGIIRRVAEGKSDQGIHFVDSLQVIEANSPESTPGEELFYEHVHLNFHGTYLVARSIFKQIQRILPAWVSRRGIGKAVLSEHECKQRLAYTGLDRLLIAEGLHYQIKQPPFTNQLYNSQQEKKIASEVRTLESRYSRGKGLQESLAQYKLALKNGDSHYHLLHGYARLQHDHLKNPTEAEIQWQRIIARYPQSSEILGRLGTALSAQGRHAEAERYYRSALTYNPRSTIMLANFGNLMLAKREVNQAITYYRDAIDIDPRNETAHSNLGKALLLKPDDPESRRQAVQHLKKAFEISPDHSLVRENLAAYYIRETIRFASRNDESQALSHLQKAFELKPATPSDRRKLAALFMQPGSDNATARRLVEMLQGKAHFDE